ncbi:MAG: sigma-70 family RNA polymerase sigma factor [Deltaproteobacteria bacterium]|nr:sigma-70 family RNA polymerase sigma factor [Deltaproteobacteria bacterium]
MLGASAFARDSMSRSLPPESVDAQDALALARFLEGDRQGFAELVRRHAPGVNALCTRMVGRAVGEELAQESFARAYASLEQLRRDTHFRHWVYRIALNLCRDHLKSARARETATDFSIAEETIAEGSATAHERAASREALKALERALGDLPPKYREAFVLWHVEHLSYEAMAEIAGADVGALKVRVHRAREMLRKALGELLDE